MDVFATHRIVDISMHSAAIVLNVTMAFVILKNSYGTLRAYKGLFMVTCVNDLLLSALTLLVKPVSH